MDWRELKERCLTLPGAVEEFPFGDEVSVFKVGGKMFALSHLDGDPLQVSVKCDPELAVQLRAAYAAIGPGYHLNKRHWNTITLDGSVADEMVGDLLGDSYDLVVASLPKARRPSGRVSADLRGDGGQTVGRVHATTPDLDRGTMGTAPELWGASASGGCRGRLREQAGWTGAAPGGPVHPAASFVRTYRRQRG
jgi:predicted DNA-binding protein (MmcQ/YjbR family)